MRPIGPWSLYWQCRVHGVGAFRDSQPIDACPYGADRGSGRAWRDAWRAAAKAAGVKLPHESRMMITFPEAKEIVRAAEEADWTVGTYMIEANGWEDATRYLVVRGAAEAMGNSPNPNFIIVPGLVPLVDKETGEMGAWCRTCPRLLRASTQRCR
jgi:hypothetical protein